MSDGEPGRPIEPPYCDACFLECARRGSRQGYYPCSPELREWAREHREDEGDARGYVREFKVKVMVDGVEV